MAGKAGLCPNLFGMWRIKKLIQTVTSKNRTIAIENIKITQKNTQKRETDKSGGICEDRKKGIYSRPPSPKNISVSHKPGKSLPDVLQICATAAEH